MDMKKSVAVNRTYYTFGYIICNATLARTVLDRYVLL